MIINTFTFLINQGILGTALSTGHCKIIFCIFFNLLKQNMYKEKSLPCKSNLKPLTLRRNQYDFLSGLRGIRSLILIPHLILDLDADSHLGHGKRWVCILQPQTKSRSLYRYPSGHAWSNFNSSWNWPFGPKSKKYMNIWCGIDKIF